MMIIQEKWKKYVNDTYKIKRLNVNIVNIAEIKKQ